MKFFFRILLIFGCALAISSYVYFGPYNLFSYGTPLWIQKEREIQSRLLSIPIILYHNINGSGPFSIDAENLRSHFQVLKERKVRVISLSELAERLDRPRPFTEKAVVITFDDGFYSMYSELLPLVMEYSYPVTLFVYVDFIYTRAKKFLTWDLLKKMEAHGINIQSHSITHPDLTELSADDTPLNRRKLFNEIYLSKRIIELYMDKQIDFFAFPYGRYDLNLVQLCQYAGYKRVFSTDYGSNILTRDNYSLRRQHIKKSFSLRFIDRLVR